MLPKRALTVLAATPHSASRFCITPGYVYDRPTQPAIPQSSLGAALDMTSCTTDEFVDLVDDLFDLNQRYRIPAAHADVVEEDTWLAGRSVILVGQTAAVARIARCLAKLSA